jgi:hypothetical protein
MKLILHAKLWVIALDISRYLINGTPFLEKCILHPFVCLDVCFLAYLCQTQVFTKQSARWHGKVCCFERNKFIRVSEDINPFVLKPFTNWVVRFRLRPPYPSGKNSVAHSIRVYVGPRVFWVLWRRENIYLPADTLPRILFRLAPSTVAIPTDPSRLLLLYSDFFLNVKGTGIR